MARTLIIDENGKLSFLLQSTLEGRGHEILSVSTEQEVMDVLKNNKVDLSICKVSSDSHFFEVLEKCKSMEFHSPTYIFITENEISIATTQRMLNLGASTCLREPVGISEILSAVNESLIKTSVEKNKDIMMRDIKKENDRLKREIKAKTKLFNHMQKNKYFSNMNKPSLDILGTSNVMLSARNSVNRLSKSSLGSKISVLISGPRGSGKEILARLIHELGTNPNSIWIPFNCSKDESIENLNNKIFSSEDNPGLLEMANNGCVFFNEVTNLPLSIQEKLCDVIQKKNADIPSEYTSNHKTGFRVIAATSENIQECIENGTFLESLYTQLNSVTVELPPLNQQTKEDIMNISEYLLMEIVSNTGLASTMHFENNVDEVLVTYAWPGNINELRNVIQRAAILTVGDVITKPSIQAAMRRQTIATPVPINLMKTPTANTNEAEETFTEPSPSTVSLNGVPYHSWKRNAVMKAEREYLQNQLEKYEGNCSAIAKEMKVTRPNLCRLLKKHDLSAKHHRWLKKQKKEAA